MKYFLLIFLVAFACPALAQETMNPDSKQPLEITADESLEWHRNDRKFIARKNALAVQGETSISAQTLTALYREDAAGKTEIYHITAQENVVINSRDTQAYGANAEYDLDKSLATLTGGDLKLVSPDQVVTARDRFEYWTVQGKLVAVGNAHVVRGQDTLDADQASAIFGEDTQGKRALKTMEATGNVVITTPTEILKGDYGIYEAGTNIATLTGNVTITRGRDILEGERAEVDLNTDISRMYGSESGGRVRGVFYPGNEEKSVPEMQTEGNQYE